MIKFGGNPSPLTIGGLGNPIPLTFLRGSIAWWNGTPYIVNTPRFVSPEIPDAVFDRTGDAYWNGVQYTTGQARVVDPSQSGILGLMNEEGTTNLLTANQASIETDTTGFIADGTATLTRVTTWARHGSASLQVANANSTTNDCRLTPSVTNALPYTPSAYIRNPGASPITVHVALSSATASLTLQPGEVGRLVATWISNTTGVVNLRYYEATGQTFQMDCLQFEQKAYATSWQLPGTARSAETTTVPTAGLLTPQAGSVKLKVYIDANLGAASVPGSRALFDTGVTTSSNRLYLQRLTGATGWRAALVSEGGVTTSATWASALSVGWHTFEVIWDALALSLWVDGVKVATIAAPVLATGFGSLAYLFSNMAGGAQLNTPGAYVAFYDHAETDAEATNYNGVSSDFTAYYDFTKAADRSTRFPSNSGIRGVLVEESHANMLNANQAHPASATGFTAWGAASLAGSTAQTWAGTSCLLVTPAAAQEGAYTNNTSVVSGQPYAAIVALRAVSGSMTVRLGIMDGASALQGTELTGITINDQGWTLAAVTVSSWASANLNARIRVRTEVGITSPFYLDGLGLFNKAYALQWCPGATTQNAETLTVPTQGLLTPSAGSVIMGCYITRLTGAERYLLRIADGLGNNFYLMLTTASKWSAHPTLGAAATSTATASLGAHIAGMTWDATGYELWVDGVLLASGGASSPFAAFASALNIGAVNISAGHFNDPINWMALYLGRKSQAAMAAGTASLVGLPSDFTAYLNFQGGALRGSTRPSNIAYTVSLFSAANAIDFT